MSKLIENILGATRRKSVIHVSSIDEIEHTRIDPHKVYFIRALGSRSRADEVLEYTHCIYVLAQIIRSHETEMLACGDDDDKRLRCQAKFATRVKILGDTLLYWQHIISRH